ncbi:MAG TPA: hypothetical protein VHY33_00065 [Thermoanaerobaculia bacterium]|jgi:hypothetical protein|nr:hypothetical protein [Thermoanaerobaculia bacterium]
MEGRPALIIAHPGHELVLFGWMEENRPVVSVLTDGSGRNGTSRLSSTLKVLRETGATPGDLAGLTDRQFYAAVLDGNLELFVGLAVRLGDMLFQQRPPYVAGDAREGFNPTHDICGMIIAAAVARAQRSGAVIDNLKFFLFEPHERHAAAACRDGICHVLSEEQVQRKIAAAHAYPELAGEVEWAFSGRSPNVLESYPQLASIFDSATEGINERGFATECLLPAGTVSPDGGRPFYEMYGEQLAADGVYDEAISYRRHVQPIEQALAAL